MRQRRVETYILDFDGDLYGDALGYEFTHHIRGQEKFDSVEALIEQMHRDVARIREVVPPVGPA